MKKKTVATVTPADVGKILGISAQAVRVQMQRGTLPIGIAMENEKGRYTYIISPKKVYEYTGEKLGGYEPEGIKIDEERLALNIAKALLPFLRREGETE